MDVKVDKDLIDWDLDVIEKAALQAVGRETDSDDESRDSEPWILYFMFRSPILVIEKLYNPSNSQWHSYT